LNIAEGGISVTTEPSTVTETQLIIIPTFLSSCQFLCVISASCLHNVRQR